MTPHGTSFEQSVQLEIAYDPDLRNPRALRLDDESDRVWEEVPAAFDRGTARIETRGFSIFAVAGDTRTGPDLDSGIGLDSGTMDSGLSTADTGTLPQDGATPTDSSTTVDSDGSVGVCLEGTTRPCRADGGACTSGTQTCSNAGQWGECVRREPVDEVCDGIDNDCDGVIDDAFNFSSDPNHCGGCDVRCSPARPYCRSGACVDGCSDGVQNGDEMGVDCGGLCPTCPCVPTCGGKACGESDGCGGSCAGACVTGQVCLQSGSTFACCSPNCRGKACGAPDGCGGQCACVVDGGLSL